MRTSIWGVALREERGVEGGQGKRVSEYIIQVTLLTALEQLASLSLILKTFLSSDFSKNINVNWRYNSYINVNAHSYLRVFQLPLETRISKETWVISPVLLLIIWESFGKLHQCLPLFLCSAYQPGNLLNPKDKMCYKRATVLDFMMLIV